MKITSKYLHELVDDPSTRHGWWFMVIIQSLIVISIVSFTIESVPNLPESYYKILKWVEWITVGVFTVEYGMRLSLIRTKFVFSIFGIIDLLSIAPFYLFMFYDFDARALKSFRIFRLLRLFKLFRHSTSVYRFIKAFKIIKHDLTVFGVAALMMIYISGAGIHYFENEVQPKLFASIFDGIWWGVVTLTTVGYGDAYPVTIGGKLFTFLILIIGLAIVAVPTGLIASALTEVRKEDD